MGCRLWGHTESDTTEATWQQQQQQQQHGSDSKETACNAGDLGLIPGLDISPEEWNGYPLRILVWKIPWTEEPGRLQSMGSLRIGHD